MSNADAQVINMVNAPHEARAREEKARKGRKRRKARAERILLELVLRLELWLIALAVAFIATAHSWVADWLGVIAMAMCLAGGAVEVGRHLERR